MLCYSLSCCICIIAHLNFKSYLLLLCLHEKCVVSFCMGTKQWMKRFYQQSTKYNKIKVKVTVEQAIRPRGGVELQVYLSLDLVEE